MAIMSLMQCSLVSQIAQLQEQLGLVSLCGQKLATKAILYNSSQNEEKRETL